MEDVNVYRGLGMMITGTYEKTAAEKAGEELYLDAYLAGFESGLGVPDGLANHTKVASQFLGRELMGEFVAKALLNK